MNLRQGTLLQGGKYRIVRFISSGGFGCTYEAEHTMLEKRVAIKEFFVKDFCNRDEVTAHVTVATQGKRSLVAKLRHKFADEAKALARMQHPGIVNVSDVFEENGTAYYVMDYVDGSSLQEILRHEERLSEERALGYIRQVADALSYVHQQNRLHLDVKPGNIMVDTEGNAVLIDFGASKQYDELDGENTSTVQGYTKGFAPPEQMTNDVVKFMPATDIYALGATLHKLLTGVTPPNATLRISGESLEALPASVCAATANAIEQAMRLNKMQRPQSIEEFLALLDAPATVTDDGQAKPAEEDTEVYAHDSESVDEDGDKIQDETPDVNDNDVSHPFSSMGEHASDTGSTTAKKSLLKRLLWPVVVGVIAVVAFFGVQAYNNLRAENARLAAIEKHRLDSIAKLKKAEEERLELLRCDSLSLIPTGVVNGYEYVDLGLSVKWAMCNVGASSPSECGDRYAWGETSTKMQFAESNSTTYGKSMSCIAGNSNHDVACAKWGDDWRLPTREEFQELLNKCTWTWTTVDDVNGYCVTGPNGENIFLPIVGDYGDYWSSTPHETNPAHSYHFYFSSSEHRLYAGGRRYSGLCIRPVLGKIERKADEQKVKEDKKQTSSAPKSEQKENTNKSTQAKEDAETQFLLGKRYYDGSGVKKDYVEAVRLWRLSAAQGYAEAQYNLALCYLRGHGVAQNDAEAAKWCRKAAAQGHIEAQYCLGMWYESGVGVTQDNVEAVKWYRKAAQGGHVEAQHCLGCCYRNGYGVEQDQAEAVRWYRKAAEQGLDKAMHMMGTSYFLGEGVTEDYVEAAKWYRKAAEKGYAGSQYCLGICYQGGWGVTKDYAEAEKWYRKAAEQGDNIAKSSLESLSAFIQLEKELDAAIEDAKKEEEKAKAEKAKQTQLTGTINGREYVDLGLSVKWATCNVGASSPSDYGNYYAWGETSTKSEYTVETYKYYNVNIGSSISGTQYDAARVNWGGTWRMPTFEEIKELIDKCIWTWTTQNGVNGYRVTGPKGKSIFLPAAGYRCGTSLDCAGYYSDYWSATRTIDGNQAYGLRSRSDNYDWSNYSLFFGFPVRPVTD